MLKTVKMHKCFLDETNYKMMNSMYMHCVNIKHLELTSVLNTNDYQQLKQFVDSLVVMAQSLELETLSLSHNFFED